MTIPEVLPSEPPEDSPFLRLELTDPVSILSAVHADLAVGLAAAFEPAPHPRTAGLPPFDALERIDPSSLDIQPGTFGPIDVETQPFVGDDKAIVAWRFDVRHVGSFFGIAATNRPVRLRGTTILRHDEEWRVYRTIDWLDALGQMGVTVAARSIPIGP